MPTRYNAQDFSKPRFGVLPLQTGYQSKSAPSDLVLPPVGIDDVHRALFNLFDKEIPFAVGGENTEVKKVPVIMAAGEKWALSKLMRAFHDRNNTLVLPIITIFPVGTVQTPNEDIAGRGINQQTGEIVIRRRLDQSDRDYQQLINRLLLPHQQNLAVTPAQGDPMQLTTLRAVGDLANDPQVKQGGFLIPDRNNNVFETIVVPAPQFFTATYDVMFWTQYTTHMNQLLEQLISSFLPQGNAWRLNTPKGYWFIATVDANSYSSETNVDDFHDEERIIKYKFTIKVPGYILATGVPGAPVPLKRYVSNPTIQFQVDVDGDPENATGTIDDPFLGADDPTLPLTAGDTVLPPRRDQRETQRTRLYPNEAAVTNPDDPAVQALSRGTRPARFMKVTGIDNKTGRQVTRLVRVSSVNRFTGETTLSSADANLGGITIVAVD